MKYEALQLRRLLTSSQRFGEYIHPWITNLVLIEIDHRNICQDATQDDLRKLHRLLVPSSEVVISQNACLAHLRVERVTVQLRSQWAVILTVGEFLLG